MKSARLLLTLSLVALLTACGTTVTPVAPIEDRSTQQPPPATSVPIEEGKAVPLPSQSPYYAAETVATDSGRVHIVQAGDTLYNIGARYGVRHRDIAQLNGITDPTTLSIGQELKIPAMPPADAGDPPAQVATIEGEALVETAPRAPSMPSPAGPGAGQAGALVMPWPINGPVIANFAATGNKGIDIAGTIGEPIAVVLDGTVQYVGQNLRGYGLFVVIRHDASLPDKGNAPLVTVYGNASRVLVKVGDKVRQGQNVALVGDTDSNRAKLRFEVHQKVPLDPLQYLAPRQGI